MKKKIKDITIAELDQICTKARQNGMCKDCPFLWCVRKQEAIGMYDDEIEIGKAEESKPISDRERQYLADLDHYDEGMGIHSGSYSACKRRLIRLARIEDSEEEKNVERVRSVKYNKKKSIKQNF